MADVRAPASKVSNFIEGTGTGGVAALIAPALMERGVSASEAALIAALVAAIIPVAGSFLRDRGWLPTRKQGGE